MIKVAIVDHSYVRDLAYIGNQYCKFLNGDNYEINYFYIAGSCFDTWTAWPQELFNVLDFEPNFIIVYLGGNSIIERMYI